MYLGYAVRLKVSAGHAEHEIMSFIELGRRPEETKVNDEILELEKKLEDAKRVEKLLQEELKDKLLILREYLDGTVLKKFLHDLSSFWWIDPGLVKNDR